MSEHFPPLGGGNVTHVVHATEALAAAGHAVFLLAWTPDRSLPADRWVERNGVRVRNVCRDEDMAIADSRRGRRRFAARVRTQLPELLRRLQPDILHVFYGHEVIGRIARAARGTPIVWTVHNVPPREYAPLFVTGVRALDWCGREGYFHLARLVHERRIRRARVTRFLPVSPATAAHLRAAGVPDHHMTVVPSGVDCRTYAPVTEEERRNIRRALGVDEGPLLLSVSGIVPHKRQDLVLRALARLRRTHAEIRFVNIGHVRDAPYHERLAALAAELGVRDACRFLPSSYTPAELASWYRASDVYLQPSSEEGFGMAALEAVSCGCRAVVAPAGVLADVVRETGAGRVVPANDPRALADAVRSLLAEGEPSLAQRARQHAYVRRRYAWEVVARKLGAVYERRG